MLPVPYFHVVYTLPGAIADIAYQNKAVIYDILFKASAEATITIAADPKHLGARIGMTSVLHTWGSALTHHPHVHMIVPGGGLSQDGARWIACRKNFFLPVHVLSRLFRKKFLKYLRTAFRKGSLHFSGKLQCLAAPAAFHAQCQKAVRHEWVVYAKPPFGGPERVLKYLARYTHRVAISNHRLRSLENGNVSFEWKDYAHGNTTKMMTLDAVEFIRRFLLHVLPSGLVRIRQFGWLANRVRKPKLEQCRALLAARQPSPTIDCHASSEVKGEDPHRCPACKLGRLIVIESLVAQPTPVQDTS